MTADEAIFRAGSKTYYRAAKLFPPAKRQDVTRLYSFVRVADDYIDRRDQQLEAFRELERYWRQYVSESRRPDADSLNARVAGNLIDVVESYDIPPEWVDAFLLSMNRDIGLVSYGTLDELRQYIYGSAEVIGLMMARILELDEEAYDAARGQGAAMQLINFVRDVAEDARLGRQYLPLDDMRRCGLDELNEATARSQPDSFARFIGLQLARYHEWQAVADQGMHYLPSSLRRAAQTAVDGYDWTARMIARDPLSVWRKQHKPPKVFLAYWALVRSIGR